MSTSPDLAQDLEDLIVNLDDLTVDVEGRTGPIYCE